MATNPIPQPDEETQALGTTVPEESPPEQAKYGPRNEDLPPELQKALVDLVKDAVRPDELPRRREILKTRKAHLFWKGQQHLWYDEVLGDLQYPSTASGVSYSVEGADDQPRFTYVLNLYQPYGLTLIAALSQAVPEVRLWPTSSTSENDITTAKASSKVIEFIERNNDPKRILREIALHLFCGGKVGSYSRFVIDGQRFGFRDQDIIGQKTIDTAPETLQCAACGFQEPTSTAGSQNCPVCGRPAQVVPTQTAQVPMKQGTEKLPNGQEVIEIVGSLELKTPIWAKCQNDFPYLVWSTEVHEAKLKSIYPKAAMKMDASGPGEQDYERLARLQTSEGGQGDRMPYVGLGDTQKLKTFHRAWLRPWLFEQIKDDAVKKQLQELFPNGVFVAMAGDAYCESREESMDDHWRVAHAMPGDGQDRPGLGESIIPVQEIFNDEANLTVETHEYGIPSQFVDSEVLDIEALEEQTTEPGAIYPVKRIPGQPVEAGFYSTPQASLPADQVKFMDLLFGPIPQFMTGAFPALQGSEQDQKTAAGQAMQRDQALGRIGLPWATMRNFYAETMLLCFNCFQKNRKQDVATAILDESDEFVPETIHIQDLKGQVTVYPEADENFPTSWAQKGAALQRLATTVGDSPQGQKILSTPGNIALMKNLNGLEELEDPDEDSRLKQYREIYELMQAAPIPGQEIPGPDGQPIPGQPQSSVPIDPDTDNNAVEAEVCLVWINSAKGQAMKKSQPDGFMNVKLHFMAHQQVLKMAAQNAVQPKPPAVTLALKGADITPEGVAQVAEKDFGVQIQPQDFAMQAQLETLKKPPVPMNGGRVPSSLQTGTGKPE